jgi:hypothetical protein
MRQVLPVLARSFRGDGSRRSRTKVNLGNRLCNRSWSAVSINSPRPWSSRNSPVSAMTTVGTSNSEQQRDYLAHRSGDANRLGFCTLALTELHHELTPIGQDREADLRRADPRVRTSWRLTRPPRRLSPPLDELLPSTRPGVLCNEKETRTAGGVSHGL